jgi:selenide, water dikinase
MNFAPQSVPFCEHGGCLAKLPGLDLIGLVDGAKALSETHDLVPSAEAPEDAAVLEINGTTLLMTTDFGPLVGVDGFSAGRIAALHALSDIYVMGGHPSHALITFVVARSASKEQAQAVLGGVFSACASEGVVASGGHTIVGEEFLIGLSVLGRAPDGGCIRKQNCRDGDILMVSKPAGTAMATRAVYHNLLGPDTLSQAISVMTQSNRPAAQAAAQVGVSALTDVTGFGLLGHLSEMLAPNQGASIKAIDVPTLPCIQELNASFANTTFTNGNLEYARRRHKLTLGASSSLQTMALLDPQTNGAVIAAVAADRAGALESSGFHAIGAVNTSGEILVQ